MEPWSTAQPPKARFPIACVTASISRHSALATSGSIPRRRDVAVGVIPGEIATRLLEVEPEIARRLGRRRAGAGSAETRLRRASPRHGPRRRRLRAGFRAAPGRAGVVDRPRRPQHRRGRRRRRRHAAGDRHGRREWRRAGRRRRRPGPGPDGPAGRRHSLRPAAARGRQRRTRRWRTRREHSEASFRRRSDFSPSWRCR